MQETWVQSLGWEDSLEKGRATHSSILTWRIPWTTDHGVTKSWTQLSDFHLEKHKAHSSTYFTVILWFCMKPFWFTCRDKGIEKTYVGRKVGYSSRTPAHPSRPSWNDICKEVSLDPWLAGILTKHWPRIIGVTCVCVCVCVCFATPHSMWNLSFSTGIKPVPTAVEIQSLNHWTTTEVPGATFLSCLSCLLLYLKAQCSSWLTEEG